MIDLSDEKYNSICDSLKKCTFLTTVGFERRGLTVERFYYTTQICEGNKEAVYLVIVFNNTNDNFDKQLTTLSTEFSLSCSDYRNCSFTVEQPFYVEDGKVLIKLDGDYLDAYKDLLTDISVEVQLLRH